VIDRAGKSVPSAAGSIRAADRTTAPEAKMKPQTCAAPAVALARTSLSAPRSPGSHPTMMPWEIRAGVPKAWFAHENPRSRNERQARGRHAPATTCFDAADGSASELLPLVFIVSCKWSKLQSRVTALPNGDGNRRFTYTRKMAIRKRLPHSRTFKSYCRFRYDALLPCTWSRPYTAPVNSEDLLETRGSPLALS
jgi:hypothetical protein